MRKTAVVRNAADQRAVLAHGIDFSRPVFEYDGQRVGALYPLHHLHDRVQRIFPCNSVQQMCDRLRIRSEMNSYPLLSRVCFSGM
jgi:hypothetical protein